MTERAIQCPSCAAVGAPVDRLTLKALLTPNGLRRGIPAQPRYCATTQCPVVYFDVDGPVTFSELDVVVPVYAKRPNDPAAPICYCFGVSVEAAQDPHRAHDLREMIAREVKAAHCACEVKNPKGACCLGDLIRIERSIEDAAVDSCCTTA